MTTTTYKGYHVKVVGLSHYTYRNLVEIDYYANELCGIVCLKTARYSQSMRSAKEWIREDVSKRSAQC